MDKVKGGVALIEQFLGVGVEIDQLEPLAASNTERISQEMKRSDLAGNVELLKSMENERVSTCTHRPSTPSKKEKRVNVPCEP